MASAVSIPLSDLFSQLKVYRWNFQIGYHPTSMSCISTSEDDARTQLINFLTKIDVMTKKYRDLLNSDHYTSSEATALYEALPKYDEIDATLDIGCYTKNIYEYHLGMKIYCYNKDLGGHECTLLEHISKGEPAVFPFKAVRVFSCLDG